jgi:Zn finger protein HypA/HybF involved in hydrogenase expression
MELLKNRSRKRERIDYNDKNLLGFKYDIFENPYVTPLLHIAYTGECPDGSAGIRHGNFMHSKTNEAIRTVTNQYHRFPQGMIFDLTNLHYEWGDWMGSVFLPLPILQTIVAVGKTKDALSTLLLHWPWSIPIFETVEGALYHIESEMRRKLNIKCPTCTGRFRGKRFTPYICPKCGTKLLIDLEGVVHIRKKNIEKPGSDSIDRSNSNHTT